MKLLKSQIRFSKETFSMMKVFVERWSKFSACFLCFGVLLIKNCLKIHLRNYVALATGHIKLENNLIIFLFPVITKSSYPIEKRWEIMLFQLNQATLTRFGIINFSSSSLFEGLCPGTKCQIWWPNPWLHQIPQGGTTQWEKRRLWACKISHEEQCNLLCPPVYS